RDGTYLPVEVSAKILPDRRWQAIIRDISARKVVERASDAVAEAVAGSARSSVQAVLRTIVLEAQLVANAEYVALGLGGGVSQPFERWVQVGMSPEQVATFGQPPGPVGLAFDDNHAIRVADIRRHPAFLGFPPHHP